LTTVTPASPSLAATKTTEEVKGKETADAKGVEANELANEQEQGENLSNGGHQDQDNTNVDHQFEGIE